MSTSHASRSASLDEASGTPLMDERAVSISFSVSFIDQSLRTALASYRSDTLQDRSTSARVARPLKTGRQTDHLMASSSLACFCPA